MNATELVKKSWQHVWQNKAVWLFGALLALTTVSGVYWTSSWRVSGEPNTVPIRIGDEIEIWIPGEGFSVEITEEEGFRVELENGREIFSFTEEFNQFVEFSGQDLSALIIFSVTWLAIVFVALSLVRYISETALIRMVDHAETTGEKPGVRQGFLLGWSGRAGKLFLIDLLVFLFFLVFAGGAIALIVGPLILATRGSFSSIILGAFGVFGLLIVAGLVITVVSALISFLMQLVRRICVIENQGVFESIRTGFRILRTGFKDVGLVWLIWIAIRIIWTPLSALAAIVLLPVLLVTLVIAVIAGGIPALLAGFVANAFTGNLSAIVIGSIFGLPFFLLVLTAPLTFVGGFVEIMKSALWTIGYRDIRNLFSERVKMLDEVPMERKKLKEAPAGAG